MGLIGEFVFTLLWAMSVSLTVLFLAARMLWIGLGVTADDLRATLRRRGVVTWTLLANVVAVPALAVVLVTALPLTESTRLAILLLAAVPGGIDFLSWKEAPPGAGLRPAALVFLLSLVAIVIAPVMRLLMQQVGPPMALSYGRVIAVSVLGLLVPLLAGVGIRAAGPAVAEVLARIAAVLSVVLFVAANLAIVVLHGTRPWAMGAVDVIVLVLFVLGAAAIGWLAGGPTSATRRLLARVTATRNVGLSLLIATVAVPHGGVDLAIVVFVVVLTVLRGLLAWLDLARRRRLTVDHAVPSA